MATMHSDDELPNPPQTGDEHSSSKGAQHAGLAGVPSHFRSDQVEPGVAWYQIDSHNPSGQCIQCFQCRQPDTHGDQERTDDKGEATDHRNVAKLVPF